MAQQSQQQGSDNSMAPVWIMVLLFITAFLIWKAEHQYIVMIIFQINIWQARLVNLFVHNEQLTNLIQRTLDTLEIDPQDVGAVVAHGNGNSKSDYNESQAIQKVFKQQEIPVTGFKWSMGHTICASGLIDAVMATYVLSSQCVPAIANLEQIASSCEGLSVRSEHQVIKGPYVLTINRGFASMNACLVIKASD
jgi:3-oxoacyl-[acyl-carrier-protein] synthase-1